MKKNTLLILLLLSAPVIAPSLTQAAQAQKNAKVAEAAFFDSLDDIPLMEGLEELPDETTTFDKPEGRIIESAALMKSVSELQVSKYYAQVLPSFGWGKAGINKYFRNDEYLELSFGKQGNRKYLKITIRPSL